MVKRILKQTLNETKQHLRSAGVDEPRLSSETIIAAALGCPRLELSLRLEEKISARQLDIVRKGIRRLAAGEPIQYVLGTTAFMGHTFKCDPRALIPRPETEELVEMTGNHAPLWQLESPRIIDIGTGTGCIVISLALLKPNGRFWAIDTSPEAIELAKENARIHKVLDSITFIAADLSSDTLPFEMDAVIANPPYVRTADFLKLEKHIRCLEPRLALDGGADGLKVIRPLVKKAFQILGKNRWLFMEIGFDQWLAVKRLILSAGFSQCSVRRDHSGHARMVIAEK